VLQLRGLGLELKGDNAGALSAYLEALEIDRNNLKEPRDFSIALNDVARIETVLGKYYAAERHFQEAIRVASEAEFADGVAAYTGRLAEVSLARDDLGTAESLARQALPLSERLGRQELIAQNCRRIAEALAQQGKKAEGLPYARRAVEIFTFLGSPRLQGAKGTLSKCGG
jgi:tetratricopeptide (TPR) repeat protein